MEKGELSDLVRWRLSLLLPFEVMPSLMQVSCAGKLHCLDETGGRERFPEDLRVLTDLRAVRSSGKATVSHGTVFFLCRTPNALTCQSLLYINEDTGL